MFNKNQELTYKTFDWLRFPLAVMVVYLHNFNLVNKPYLITNWEDINGMDIFNIVRVYGSLLVTNIAVPLFFVISGFLFFKNFDKWNWRLYLEKLKRRFYTLLIPYLTWITIAIIIAISLKCMSLIIHHEDLSQLWIWSCDKFGLSSYWNSEIWNSDRLNWLGYAVPSYSPYLVPMWFIRDLILMVVLSPIIYICITWGGKLFMEILFLSYISLVWPYFPGFDIESVFYFTLGGWLVINNVDLFPPRRYKLVISSFALLLSVVLIYYYGHITFWGNKIYPFFILSGVMAIFFISSNLVNSSSKQVISTFFIGLKDTSFFIFAFHTIILGYVNLLLKKMLPDHYISYILIYVFSPLVIVTICVIIYKAIKSASPMLSKILSGR